MKRSHHDFRLASSAHDKAELAEQLEAFLQERSARQHARTVAIPVSRRGPCSSARAWASNGGRWDASCWRRSLSFARAVEEVSDLFGKFAGWSLLDKLTADETNVANPGNPFRATGDLRAAGRRWRRCGDRGVSSPRPCLGHSAGEMAAPTFPARFRWRTPYRHVSTAAVCNTEPPGRARCWRWGFPREEATQLVARHPRAISIAAINGAEFDHALRAIQAVLAEIDKTLDAGGSCSAARCRSTCPIHSPKMEQLEAELLECLRDIRPQAGIDPVLLHGDRHRACRARSRCAVLVPECAATGAVPRHHGRARRGRAPACSSRSAHIRSCDTTSRSA